ncbi:conserved unknown protein [Ectocarpus siliculosus]|uniref:Uncharacterized protein n=1 Tax=Ectocarpus siliculosus TaxID=2880 RepID=D7G6M1_ECTSI|nr:conserved unknown protein [Ectocarpus siliculosus]|eukprot:CBJ33960.1 conserved unknown protein [Ectocarpus siliculosus]
MNQRLVLFGIEHKDETRSDKSLAICDIHYVRQWRQRRGAPSAQAAAAAAATGTADSAAAVLSSSNGSLEDSRSSVAAAVAAAATASAAAGGAGGNDGGRAAAATAAGSAAIAVGTIGDYGGGGGGGGGSRKTSAPSSQREGGASGFLVGSFGSVRSGGSGGGSGGGGGGGMVAGMLSSMTGMTLAGSTSGARFGSGGGSGNGQRMAEEFSDDETDGVADDDDNNINDVAAAAVRSRGRRARAGTAPATDSSGGRTGNRVDFLDASGSNAAAVVGGGGSAAGSGEIWPIPKGDGGWDSAVAAAENAHADLGGNEGYASLAWLPGTDSVLLAGTGSKFLKSIDVRGRGDDALRSADSSNVVPRTMEVHKGGVIRIAVLPEDPRIVATWSDSVGEPVKLWKSRSLVGRNGGGGNVKARDASQSSNPVATLRPPDKTSFVVDIPSRYELTKHPVSRVSWQPPRVTPRPIAPWALSGAGGGGATAAAAVTKAITQVLAEDERIAVTFPQRMLTVGGPFVENIGPWFQTRAMATSAHGDVGHTKGFREAEGNPERSGLMTRLGEDAASLSGQELGQRELADVARRRIARSGKPPLMTEVMKWRAQAQYRSDAVYNRDTIFDEEVANQVGISSSSDIHPLLENRAVSSTTGTGTGGGGGGSGAIMAIATADILSGWHLWDWVARVEALCEEQRVLAAKAAATSGGSASGGGGGG